MNLKKSNLTDCVKKIQALKFDTKVCQKKSNYKK